MALQSIGGDNNKITPGGVLFLMTVNLIFHLEKLGILDSMCKLIADMSNNLNRGATQPEYEEKEFRIKESALPVITFDRETDEICRIEYLGNVYE